MANYEALKNKQAELIRKALDGSVFIADIAAAAVANMTSYSATASAAKLSGSAAAVAIVTAGNLVLKIGANQNVTIALAAADAPSGVVTKANAVLTTSATAALEGGVLTITSTATGAAARVQVVGGTGSVLANLKVTGGQVAVGSSIGISLAPLPALYDDLGWLTNDGAAFSRDVATSEVSSWGSVSPTRTDITSDTTTMSVTAQETKLLTVGLATGADLSGVLANFSTGEVSIAKPSRPKSRHYRVLSMAVDQGDAGEIYIARFLPRAKVTGYSEQAFGGGDDPVLWGVTFTGEEDSSVGYSERWIFGGPGWDALLPDMGFDRAAS